MILILILKIGLALSLALPLALPARAADPSDRERAQQDEIQDLRRQLGAVIEDLQTLKREMAVPESDELQGAYGLGPAASKVYGISRGLSIGGYAEAVYRNRIGDASGDGDDTADFTRVVLYVGWKFSDSLLFNTELEFEHASTSEAGSVSVEFAALDWLWRDELNVRAGLVLVPMGLVNEVHEPPFYFGTQRPEVERRIIPSTWRENGVGIFGALGETLRYRLYVVNGLDAAGFDSFGLRGGRQKGSEALAEDLGVVGRLDFRPFPGLGLGASYYTGNSGHDQRLSMTGAKLPHVRTQIYEAHAEYERGPFTLRGLIAGARVGDAGKLSTLLTAEQGSGVVVAREMFGGYVEGGVDVLRWLSPTSEVAVLPFFRFEYLDTQRDLPPGLTRVRSRPRRLFIPGLQIKPHPNVVLKIDYRNVDDWAGSSADELSFGFGLVF